MGKYVKILSILLALMIAASAILVSCGSSETPATKTPETTTAAVSTTEAPKTETPTVTPTPEPTPTPIACSTEQTTVTITFICVDAEGKEITKSITTAEKFLRGALEQENLIKGDESEWGLMVSEVCGIRADYTLDGAYWSLYIGDEYAQTGVDATEIADGGVYKFVYTKA